MPGLCAITGSNGYVGGCLKSYFAARGREILELTRRPAPGARAVAFQLGADISPETLAGVGTLVHCAYDFQPLHREEIQTVNVDGTRKLLQAARAAGIGRIVCLSSISAYDGCRSLYGKAKLEIEKIALDHGALVQFLVHQEDLAAFIEKVIAGKMEMAPRVLTAAHERAWPFRELLSEIARGLNKKVKFVPVPWRLLWAGLKTAEACGLRLNFRSDSLVSLMHQNANPDFSPNAAAGLICRPFRVEALDF